MLELITLFLLAITMLAYIGLIGFVALGMYYETH